jgi:hypothetical protein
MKIPLQNGSANAHQKFTVQLGENSVEFRLSYIQTGQWSMNLYIEGELIAAGVMLEPNADILKNYNLKIGGSLYFIGKDTTLKNLGVENSLHWIGDDE